MKQKYDMLTVVECYIYYSFLMRHKANLSNADSNEYYPFSNKHGKDDQTIIMIP